MAAVSERVANCILATLFTHPSDAILFATTASTNGSTKLDTALLEDVLISQQLPACIAHLQRIPVEDFCWDKMLPQVCLLIAQRASIELLAYESSFKSFLAPKTVAAGMRSLHLFVQKIGDSVRSTIHEVALSQVFTQSPKVHDPALATRAASQFANPPLKNAQPELPSQTAVVAPPAAPLRFMPEKSPFQGMVYVPRPQTGEPQKKTKLTSPK